ncbi:Ff.00g064630.m01.CDS01 [Fusarium sp. VM40]|nr:Ff.00g064630.m01.CDS01 [Fusarium sp. VM40]
MIGDRQHHWMRFYNVDYAKDCILLPPFSPEVQSFRDHGYMLRPLFRALFLVFDHLSLSETPDLCLQAGNYTQCIQQILSHEVSNYPVLLVKTGLKEDFSSSIKFLSLFNAGLAMNVDRQNYYKGLEPSVVRVRLDTAIQFIWDLLQMEQNDCDYQAWVSNAVTLCQQVGLEGQGDSWLAIRRSLARKENESFDLDQLSPYTESQEKW